MHRILNFDDLAPESAHLVKALMDPYNQARNQEAANENIVWTASKNFTVDDGQRQIHEYIKKWELSSSWLYSLDYLGVINEQFFTFYHYRARFSTPTARNPVVGTASVYFTVKPDTLPVDVHYVVESNRLVHRADRVVFREKWLADVIESKVLLRRTVQDLWTELQTPAAAVAAGGTMDSAPS